MKHKLFFTAAIVAVIVLFTPAQVSAQQNKIGLSITPLSFDLSLKPGENKTNTVYLTNLSNEQVEIAVEPRNFFAKGENGDITLTKDAIAYALSSWVNVSPNHVIMPPKEKVEFRFTINVPDKPEPGGHFGAIIFSTVPKKDLKKSAAYLTQEIGALIFVKTPGDIKEKASIASFTPGNSFYEFGPVNFITRVKNDSNIHIRPTGSVTITDMLGNKETINVEPENVLPGAIRRLQAGWNKNLLFGKYKAEVKLTYGTKGETLTAQTSFWAFPVRWGLLALGIIMAIIIVNTLVVLSFIRISQKKNIKQAQ